MPFRTATHPNEEPSNYMQELTRYLSNIMGTVLLGLPTEIKELIYFDALSHAATMILASPSISIATQCSATKATASTVRHRLTRPT